ncbi:hypothetical protein BJ994_001999 [Arthrobacter pigmenti]|uniref:Integral membrane protein n=1 Tax=Arthrobacter pigmenti TaxID=271432 RepID=A0A846RIC2_9MICC|nr:hypothetical protein [Arthrobacter pigmenti]
MSRPPGQPQSPRSGRPPGVAIIAVILVCEAVALFAVAGWFVYGLLTSAPASLGGAVFMVVLLILFAVWLLVVGHFFYRGYRWTRSASLVFQFFVMVVAIPTLTAGIIWLGLLLLIPAVLVLHQLFTRDVIAFTSRTGEGTPAL